MLPAEGFQPTLSKLVDVLDHFRIRFHVTGGLTSVVYGEPLAARTDAALSKLVWIHRGSHRSRRDLRWMMAGASPDEVATVRQTAADMDLLPLLDEVLAESDEVDA